jgi:hypothetical protein
MNKVVLAVVAVFALAGVGMAYGALSEGPCDTLYRTMLFNINRGSYNWPSDVNNDRVVNMTDLKTAAPYLITHDEAWCAARLGFVHNVDPNACTSYNRLLNRSIRNGAYWPSVDVNLDCVVDFEDQALSTPFVSANDANWCSWRNDIRTAVTPCQSA